MSDRYELGDWICRWSPVPGPALVTMPGGYTYCQPLVDRCWYMVAARLGTWSLCWPNGETETFEIVRDRMAKDFDTLIDGDLSLVPLRWEHIQTLRGWRNANRQWFFDQALITAEGQARWFYTVYLDDPTDYLWIACLAGKPFGTGSLTHIDLDKRCAEWSRLLVGEDWARGQGLAGRITRLVRDYALDVLRLERIYGSLWTHNRVTLYIDEAAGYKPYREEDGITYVELLRKAVR